ncbi:MAG TPA: EAL domain-containing protein [Janthinobacterium sp.]|nr:EAL domain-containing protein [Janthinobacterium sp.]
MTILFLVVWQSPFQQILHTADTMPLWIHCLSETFAIAVSFMAFGIAWNAYSPERPSNILILACGFLAVGLLDFAHMLSFPGMPDFVTPSHLEKAINFWLAARFMAAATMLTVALRGWHSWSKSASRHRVLMLCLGFTALALWLGLFHQALWPRTFIQGEGLTVFKVTAEFFIILILLVSASRFYLQTRQPQSYDVVSLFAASAITILSELCFTLYSDTTDFFNLLGHIYKIVAYVFIYRAIFVSSVRHPFLQLQHANKERDASRAMLQSVLDNVPVRIFWKDQESRYLGANNLFLADAGVKQVAELIGKTDFDLFPTDHAHNYRGDDRRVIDSGTPKLNFEEPLKTADGKEKLLLTSKVPLRGLGGEIAGVLGSYTDISLIKSQEEHLRLSAKVFESSSEGIYITDASERILFVNQAFKELSGYTAEEVAGKTPRVMRSGRHDAAFYQAMWASILGSGQWQGEIWNCRKNGEIYPGWLCISTVLDGAAAVTHYVGVFSDISERKANERQLAFLAYHDALTQLPNRLLLQDRFHQATTAAGRMRCKVALLFLDLDNFKMINDSLGHSVGDLLITAVAQRLGECLRDSDTVSRQGGDEFLVLLPALPDKDAIMPVLIKIMARLQEPFHSGGHEISTSISAGVALYPDDGEDFDTLLKKSDMAMYRAKDAGRNAYCFFDEYMNEEAVENLSMRSGLRRAIERKEFVLHYQPQIDLVSGAVVGAEALIRWDRPGSGMVAPGRFIPVAEESGLIVSIGEWVLHEACRQAAAWRKAGLPELIMAVNLSAIQFKRGDLEQTVISVLQESGLDPALLELELTESILIKNSESVLSTVKRLKLLGVKLSIDDFGTGYSSLSYLKRFAVDKLKIDQSFIRDLATDPEDAAIVRAIIQMARSLSLRTVAEGVEYQQALDDLRMFRCDEAQGYLFARPLSAGEFENYLSDNLHPTYPSPLTASPIGGH